MAGATADEKLVGAESRGSFTALCERAASLRHTSAQIRRHSDLLRVWSRRLRVDSVRQHLPAEGGTSEEVPSATQAPPADRAVTSEQRSSGDTLGFRLRGVVDGAPVVADWTPGGPVASDALMVRADLVVRLAERFVGADGRQLAASLEGSPTQALLTFIRACDRVESVTTHLGVASSRLAAGGAPAD